MAEENSGKPRDDRSDRDRDVPGMPKGWRPGDLIVIPLGPEDEFPESRMDFSLPFWVGTPVE